MKQYRQGDVFLKEVIDLPETDGNNYHSTDIEKSDSHKLNKEVVLAYGEVTGHKHAVSDRNAALVKEKDGSRFFLLVFKNTDLVHEEHDKINLPVGKYEFIRQRTYSRRGVRHVED
jgi:hypothetical protein